MMVFNDFLYRLFPQWRGKLNEAQEHDFEMFARDITSCADMVEVCRKIEDNFFLLLMFSHYVEQMLHPHQSFYQSYILGMLFLVWLFSVFGLWGIKNQIDSEYLTGLSMMVGAFGTMIRYRWKNYIFLKKN